MCANPEHSLELSQLLIENISNEQTFNQLILNGANVNAQNTMGWCVLFELISTHTSLNIYDLNSKGIDFHIRDTKGRNALFWAIHFNNVEAVKLLLSLNVDLNIVLNEQVHIFEYVIYKGDLTLLKSLIDSGLDVNEKNSSYSVPLIFAVLYGKIQMAHYLIDKGADGYLVDAFGNCAYSLAQTLKVESILKNENLKDNYV